MMTLRYLRRPPKFVARKTAARKVKCAASQSGESLLSKPAVEIAPGERAKLAQALAYFCAACGREHASGDVRDGDLVCAEAEIIAVINRAQ